MILSGSWGLTLYNANQTEIELYELNHKYLNNLTYTKSIYEELQSNRKLVHFRTKERDSLKYKLDSITSINIKTIEQNRILLHSYNKLIKDMSDTSITINHKDVRPQTWARILQILQNDSMPKNKYEAQNKLKCEKILEIIENKLQSESIIIPANDSKQLRCHFSYLYAKENINEQAKILGYKYKNSIYYHHKELISKLGIIPKITYLHDKIEETLNKYFNERNNKLETT